MDNEVTRTHFLGMLAEEGREYLDIGENTRDAVLTFVKELVLDDDDSVQTAKLIGLALAQLEFEDLV